MTEPGLQIRCQRCGEPMDLVDPAPGQPWTPQQYWVCPACGRHFWSTYPSPTGRAASPPARPAASPDPRPAGPGSTPPSDPV